MSDDIVSAAEYEHKLGQSTIRAVSILCDKTATEIEAAAASLMVAAQDVDQHLKDLAAAMRKQGAQANDRVSAFVNMAASVVETARSLKSSIEDWK